MAVVTSDGIVLCDELTLLGDIYKVTYRKGECLPPDIFAKYASRLAAFYLSGSGHICQSYDEFYIKAANNDGLSPAMLKFISRGNGNTVLNNSSVNTNTNKSSRKLVITRGAIRWGENIQIGLTLLGRSRWTSRYRLDAMANV